MVLKSLANITVVSLLVLLTAGCYSFDLKVTKEGARLKSGAYHKSRTILKLPVGAVLKKTGKVKHWYKVEYLKKVGKKEKKYRGYVYRYYVVRQHHFRDIYSRKYKETDTLALMITLPVFFILITVWLAASKSRRFNIILAVVLVYMMLVQTVYVLARDTATKHRSNAGFRIMIDHIRKLKKKSNIYVWFTDVTWAARIEVLTDFGMHFDRFSRDKKYNSKARMHYISSETNLSRVRGYVITDPFYYGRHVSWQLPEQFYTLNYPANWRLVRKVGSARLYYAR